MTNVVYYVAVSTDGYIAGLDGSVAWLDDFQADGLDYGYHDFLKTIGALVMGSKTYEQIVGFGTWPYSDLPTVVLTRRALPSMDGAVLEFYSGDLQSRMDTLRASTKGDIWLVGGGTAASSFLKAGLIDELRIFVMPAVLGKGIPLFPDAETNADIALQDYHEYKNGVTELRFAVKQSA